MIFLSNVNVTNNKKGNKRYFDLILLVRRIRSMAQILNFAPKSNFGAILFLAVFESHFDGRERDVQELPVSGGVVVRRVAVSGHDPLGRQESFDADRASSVDPSGGDSNLGS